MSIEKDIKLKIGIRIRNLREKNNITQEKLGELSEIDYKHIQLLEGKKPSAVRIDNLEKICEAFEISLSEFFDDDMFF